jgi:hypothetical protein
MLQYAIPCFEDLLPSKHNKPILDLLFLLASWHAYAKLRIHTNNMLADFENVTSTLGKQLQHFIKHTCEAFNTKELPKEQAAREHQKAAQVAKGQHKTPIEPSRTTTKTKKLNLNTYKLHALGDYPDHIQHFGTTDSYSTQTVSLHTSII